MASRKISELNAAIAGNLHNDALVPVVDLTVVTPADQNVKATVAQVRTAIINANSVNTAAITDLNVTEGKIAANAVTNAKLATTGLDAAKLTIGTLPIARIDDLAVTNAKLAASGLDAGKLTIGTLPIARIADGAVTGAKLGGTHGGTQAPWTGAAVNSTSLVTMATRTISDTVAVGDSLIVRGSLLILNNSGATRTYALSIQFAGFAVSTSAVLAAGASSTQRHVIPFEAEFGVESTGRAVGVVCVRFGGLAGAAAGTTANHSTTMPYVWGTTTSNLTGASKTVLIQLSSDNTATTQTAGVVGFKAELVKNQ